jgi:hypothetical protein
VAPAVASSQWSTGLTGAGGARPGKSGSTGRSRAAAPARSTSAARLSGSVRLDVTRASRPSTASVSATVAMSSVTFWWMRLLAKRVSDDVPTVAVTSASAPSPTRDSVRSQISAGSTIARGP